MDKFEGVFVGYMFNQAQMSFTPCGNYPAYTLNEEGEIVVDNSDFVKDFQAKARHYKELVKKTADRIKRGKRVPMTWIRDLEIGGLTMVIVLEEYKMTYSEWAAEYHRMVRYLTKAALVSKIAAERGLPVIDVKLSEVDPSDMLGLPTQAN